MAVICDTQNRRPGKSAAPCVACGSDAFPEQLYCPACLRAILAGAGPESGATFCGAPTGYLDRVLAGIEAATCGSM
jgi:hypothetical protein